MEFIKKYLNEFSEICNNVNINAVYQLVVHLKKLRKKQGRLFILGVGGSAANASHATNDFRKICNIETYAPSDNISEITARTNDDGWETVFKDWLVVSKITARDSILFFSVGGGSIQKKVSINLINAAKYAKRKKVKVLSIIGKKNGYLKKISDICCLLPTTNYFHITPHSETYQVMIWHLIISHPLLKINKTKW